MVIVVLVASVRREQVTILPVKHTIIGSFWLVFVCAWLSMLLAPLCMTQSNVFERMFEYL
jgi:hypothetical protein